MRGRRRRRRRRRSIVIAASWSVYRNNPRAAIWLVKLVSFQRWWR
jgi:hypothetical protein